MLPLAFALLLLLPLQETQTVPTVAKHEAVRSPSEDIPADVQLLRVKRIYVESFGDDDISRQLHAMVVSSLTGSKRFIVTENKDKADATLKGSALEKTSKETHAYSEGTAAGAAGGGASWNPSGGSAGWAGKAAAIEDSALHTETIDHARVAVRLLNKNGDVIWAATDESKGAKYKGASADAADKVVKRLLRHVEKLEKPQAATNQN